MKKQNKISSSKPLFSSFIQLYLHSLKSKILFWIIVFGAGKSTRQIQYKSHSQFVNYLERTWVAHKPQVDRMFDRSLAMRGISALVALFAVVVLMQFLYPNDRALPQARLEGGDRVGFMKSQQIQNRLLGLDTQVVTVQTPSIATTATYQEMGLNVDLSQTFDNTRSYSFAERLVPFSVFFERSNQVSRQLDETKFADFTDRIIEKASENPTNAKVHLNGTKLVVEPSKDGFAFQQESLKKQLLVADLFANQPILFKPDLVPPAISTTTANQQAQQMQERIDTPLVVLANEQSMKVDPETIASWVRIDHQPEKHQVDITLRKDKIIPSLSPIRNVIDKDPIPIQVTLLNGFEAGRTTGELGAILDVDKLAGDIAELGFSVPKNIWGKVESINPPETIERRYTRDSQGFQALIDYWSQSKPGQHGISLQTTDGYISASQNAHQSFGIGGMSNIFIASQIYGRIAAGSLSKSTATSVGSNVGSCLRNMMVFYNTSCMAVLGNAVGWGDGDSMLAQQGFSQTSLASGSPRSTTSDTTRWLASVLNRSITTYDQTNEILDYMSNQVQRSGIPAGSFGFSVANQAGITSSGVVADHGIVFHPSRNYILSVYSTGATFADIAELAREINKVLSE